jgi:hypothetical protein
MVLNSESQTKTDEFLMEAGKETPCRAMKVVMESQGPRGLQGSGSKAAAPETNDEIFFG